MLLFFFLPLQPTHMSLGNGSSIITSSIPGLITQTAVANGNSKAQGNGVKGQGVQNQAQNASAAIASMVAKQPTVLPAQQNTAPPVVLGQIGVFSNQGNPGLGSNFVPQVIVLPPVSCIYWFTNRQLNFSISTPVTSPTLEPTVDSPSLGQNVAALHSPRTGNNPIECVL